MHLKWPVLMCALAATAFAASTVKVVEEIVAKVNGDIITLTDLERSRQQIEGELRQKGVNGPALDKAVKEGGRDSLRNQIDQLLLVQKGKDLNINVDAEVTKQLGKMQVESKITDPDKFHDFIREQTGMTFEDLGRRSRVPS